MRALPAPSLEQQLDFHEREGRVLRRAVMCKTVMRADYFSRAIRVKNKFRSVVDWGPVSNDDRYSQPKRNNHEIHDADDSRCLPGRQNARGFQAGAEGYGSDGTVQ